MSEKTKEKGGIRKPLKKGVAKVPVVMQMEALECGAACLAMVMAYYRKWVPLEQVRVDCGVSRDGSKAKNVILAAGNYGFEASGYRMELNAIRIGDCGIATIPFEPWCSIGEYIKDHSPFPSCSRNLSGNRG